MKRLCQLVALATFLLLANNLFAQKRDFLSEIKLYKIQDKKLGEIQLGVLKGSSINQRKPLLLLLQGSGDSPTFIYVKSANFVANTIFGAFQNFKDQYHIVYINKAGFPLFDSVATPRIRYPVTAFAVANSTKDWRAESAAKAIDFLLKELPVTPGKVYVAGHSEGAQVAAKVAVLNKRVAKVVVMNTNALDHIYERIIDVR
ncbi:alpha/beta hydrolase [Hymenobacter terrenus]|uniref:alpha/beta hydrolase n=1 Tax=Hymenobacter terrenus TaxID=1629124 RepID=UPI00061A01FF|nr:alpha/beta hydrolase [Hymenobacter terrenus]